MMTKERFTKNIIYFMSPGVRAHVLGCGHNKHIVRMPTLIKIFSTTEHGSDKLHLQ